MERKDEVILEALKHIIEKLTNRGEEYPLICGEIDELLEI